MKILASAKLIRKALKDVCPTEVAVAFVGVGWNSLISAEHLKEIVISPRVGSNPLAIEQLIKTIGISNVHLLDRLHSKIYLSDQRALLGSCNLSANGTADAGNFEAAVLLDTPASIRSLKAEFIKYKLAAQKQYKTAESKWRRLELLMAQRRQCEVAGVVSVNKAPKLAEYESRLHRIHLVWFEDGKLKYDKANVNAADPESTGRRLDDYYEDDMQFHHDDDVRVGDWLLCWKCRRDGYPDRRGNIYWMAVDVVIRHGYQDETYTKLVAQRKGAVGTPPFDLDAATIAAIRENLDSGVFPKLLRADSKPWKLNPADKVWPLFLKRIKQCV